MLSKKLISILISFLLFVENSSFAIIIFSTINSIAVNSYATSEEESDEDESDECDEAIEEMDNSCSDESWTRFGKVEEERDGSDDVVSQLGKTRRANGNFIASCEPTVVSCSNACSGDNSGEKACKSVKDGKLKNAKSAQEQLNKSGQGAEKTISMLGSMIPLLAMLFNKKKSSQPASTACVGTACTTQATAPADRRQSSGGGLYFSNYKPYLKSNEGNAKDSVNGAQSGDLAKSKGTGSTVGGAAATSSGGGSFGQNNNAQTKPNTSPVAAASVEKEQRFDTNISEGFYSAGGGASSGGSNNTASGKLASASDAGYERSSLPQNRIAQSFGSGVNENDFNRILNKAKRALNLPTVPVPERGVASMGDIDGDNFLRIHQTYQNLSHRQQLED